jgi:hypothetical protein
MAKKPNSSVERRGGARKNAGRKKGSKSSLKHALNENIIKRIADENQITPLEVLMEAMHFHWNIAKAFSTETPDDIAAKSAAMEKAASYARDAAPYVHPRLQATTLKGDPNAPLSVNFIDDIK